MSALAAGLLVAGTALALISPHVPQPSAGEEAGLSTLESSATETPAGAGRGPMAATMARATAAAGRAVPRPATSCQESSEAFLAPQCRLARTGKSHMTRAAHAARHQRPPVRVARADADVDAQAGPSEPAAAGPPIAAVAKPEAPPPGPEKRATPKKKPVKIAHKRAPTSVFVSRDSLNPPRPYGFELFSAFHDPRRPGAGAWAMLR
jgi:hypothetical protein